MLAMLNIEQVQFVLHNTLSLLYMYTNNGYYHYYRKISCIYYIYYKYNQIHICSRTNVTYIYIYIYLYVCK